MNYLAVALSLSLLSSPLLSQEAKQDVATSNSILVVAFAKDRLADFGDPLSGRH